MSTKDLSYLLVGETSQGRGSDERKEALIHLITISKSILTQNEAIVLKDKAWYNNLAVHLLFKKDKHSVLCHLAFLQTGEFSR